MAARALAAAVSLALACAARAAVHEYKAQQFYSVGDAYIFRGGREGLVKSQSSAVDALGSVYAGVNNGKSYIRFSKVNFQRPADVAAEVKKGGGGGDAIGMVQAVVFEVQDRQRVGYLMPDGVTRRYCCTQALVGKTGCEPGRLIVQQRPDEPGWPWVTDIYFEDQDTVAYAVDDAVTIERTGMYYLWFVVCDPNLAGVQVYGQTTWKNPGGYLPGMMAPNLRFFAVMSLAYLALGVVWFAAYALNWRTVLTLQNCVTLVIALSMCEMATWYFDFESFNISGYRPYATTLLAVVVSAARKAVSRMLLLVVSMGYGVVKPTLGGLQNKVVGLGAVYFVATALLDVMTNVGTIDDLDSSLRVILVLPVAVLDAVFILWIFTSLSRTLSQLQARRQSAKLDLYRKFTNMLALVIVVSIAWIAYEMYFKVTDRFNERWQEDWITNAFWHVLSLALLCGICILWAPNKNAVQYAYSEDDPDDADELLAAGATVEDGGKPAVADVFSLEGDGDEPVDGKVA